MKILITGISGFVGSHFADFLLSNFSEVEIHGTVLPASERGEFARQYPRITSHPCDINVKDQIRRVLEEVKPDRIFHLAAQSYVSSSWENPELTLHTNIIGQSNLLEAVRSLKVASFDPVVVLACSSEEYGPVKEDGVVYKEDSPLHPQSPYAISKIAQDFMGYQYNKSYGLQVIRLRSFNHTGPRRDPVFGVSAFCKKIAEIENGGSQPEMIVRDLTAVRDFTDVRDIVRAYWEACDNCLPGEAYNVCSGRGISFKEILDELLVLSTVKNIRLIPDPAGPRPTDGGRIVGDNGKFCSATGWKPKIDFLKQTLPQMLDYWRKFISAAKRQG
ncbi:MAG: GDP-mannose 4,6-dehydratase [bacterium]|nr:GDP-mannose 4,6-dehydratase [bacterium]